MHTFQLFWRDHGELMSTARNQVHDDPRPLMVRATEWQFSVTGDSGNFLCINFYNEENEIFLSLFEIPIMIKQLDAVPQQV